MSVFAMCDVCGAIAPAVLYKNGKLWMKPHGWFQSCSIGIHLPLSVCGRECAERADQLTMKRIISQDELPLSDEEVALAILKDAANKKQSKSTAYLGMEMLLQHPELLHLKRTQMELERLLPRQGKPHAKEQQ